MHVFAQVAVSDVMALARRLQPGRARDVMPIRRPDVVFGRRASAERVRTLSPTVRPAHHTTTSPFEQQPSRSASRGKVQPFLEPAPRDLGAYHLFRDPGIARVEIKVVVNEYRPPMVLNVRVC